MAQMDCLELVYEVLKDVELEHYFPRIRDDLNVTKLAHFDHVKVQDLTQIGLGRPAARRLLSAVKRRKAQLGPNILSSFLDVLNPKSCGSRGARRAGHREEPLYSNVHREPTVSCLITKKDIVIKEKIGQGSFGEVLKAEWTRGDGSVAQVAVKILRNDALALPGAFGDFVKEVNAMIGLNHPNLIKLYGVSLSSPYMIVQELAPLGSVLDRLRKECSLTSVAVIVEWAKQICQGMAYLERQRWIHRDLAARNVLLSSLDKIKIGDFGLMKSIQADDDCYVMTEHKKIPFPWCAPECLKLRKFSHASDCWAYGVTLWELFTFGEHPWAGNNGAQILQLIDQEGKRLIKPRACPPEAYSVMLNCWAHREHDRPTFSALNEFFQNVHLGLLKAAKSLDEPDRLQMSVDDEIVVIDGQPENHWWTGQNKRTLRIGSFPRNFTKELRVAGWKASSHISKPLRHSFIHAGHGDTDPTKTFGSPTAIDEIFLRNPVPPIDVLGPSTTFPSQTPSNPTSKSRPTSKVITSEDVLLDFITPPIQPPSAPLHPTTNTPQPPEVNYFNIPPGFPLNTSHAIATTPSAPGYHYYVPPGPQGSLPLPERPISYGNFPQPLNFGLFYSNVVTPTVSPGYSPQLYYNTASYVIRPAPAPPIAHGSGGVEKSSGVLPKPEGKIRKGEKVIKTYPVPLSIDPFDTSVVSSDLWSDFKEKDQGAGARRIRGDSYRLDDELGLEGLVLGEGDGGSGLDRLFGNFVEERSKRQQAPSPSLNSLLGRNTVPSRVNSSLYPAMPLPSPWQPVPPAKLHQNTQPPTQSPQLLISPSISAPATSQDDSGISISSDDEKKPKSPAGMSSVLDDMLRAIQAAVPGQSSRACEEALRASRFDQEKTVKALKIGLLLRLAVAEEPVCRDALEKHDWDVERAGAALLGN